MGQWTVFLIAAFAFTMAFIFAASAFSLAPGNAAVPVSLSFTAIGMLSGTVGFTLKRQDDRIAALERKLSATNGVA